MPSPRGDNNNYQKCYLFFSPPLIIFLFYKAGFHTFTDIVVALKYILKVYTDGIIIIIVFGLYQASFLV